MMSVPAVAQPGPTPAIPQYTPLPKNAPQSWLGADVIEIHRPAPGRTVFTLTVDSHGHVAACEIENTTGSTRLDQAICESIGKRAQFVQSVDEWPIGKTGTYQSAIMWLPKPSDPPFAIPALAEPVPHGARVRGSQLDWITEKDFSKAHDTQGIVRYSLSIDATGAVTNCTIVATSGSAKLDELTCKLITDRARFDPARDSLGHAAKGSFQSSVNWRRY